MELIRCDQCKREIDPSMRHFLVRLNGMVRFGFDTGSDSHFCSESCVALYFNRETVTTPATPLECD